MTKFAEEFLAETYFSSHLEIQNRETLSVDLGSGTKPRNPFLASRCMGIDRLDSPSVVKCDLFNDPIPVESASADFITAFDFIEHIPRVIVRDGATSFRFVEMMGEIYRVLRPGGLFFSHTPAFPSPAAFQDPTHVNIITDQTFPRYFCLRTGKRPGAANYGFTTGFEFLSQRMYRTHLLTLLRRPG